MTSIVAGGLLGLALGVRHTIEPDHLAAVGTFVSRAAQPPRRAALVGAMWGAGHTAGLLVLGALVLALRGVVPHGVDMALELCVGLMLIVLGGRAFLAGRSLLGQGPKITKSRAHWGPFAVGLGHGIAGTGAAVLLASATMPSVWMGIVFLGLFGVGSVLGMATIAGILSLPMKRATTGRGRHPRLLQMAGAISIGVGVSWMLRSTAALI